MTAPSAVGTLADTPLAHALIYARNRRLSGRLELAATDERRAAISLWRGRIVAVQITPAGACAGAFLGSILYEQGSIDTMTLDSSLLEIARTKRLHGEVLLERQAITTAQRDEALVEQVHRKIHYLFTLPEATSYAFFDDRSVATEPPVAVDPVGPVWRGVREYPPTKFVEETMRRVGQSALRATDGGSARLPPAETQLTAALATRPMTVAEMKSVTDLPGPRVELLVYLLVIAKCVEAVSGARTHPSTGQLPTGMPSGPMPAVGYPSSGSMRAQSMHPASGVVRSPTPMSMPRISVTPPPRTITPSGIPAQRISLTPPPKPLSSSKIPAQRPFSMTPPAQALSASKFPPRAPSGPPAALVSPSELGLEGIALRAASVETEDYFHLLGLVDNASAEAVRAAYVRLAKTWHPDRAPAELHGVRNEIAKIFSHMSRAQQTLCDADARRGYLASRAPSKPKVRPRSEVMRELEHATTRRDSEFVIQLCQELIDADAEDAEAIARQAWATVAFGEASEDELRAALPKMDRAVNVDRTDDQAVYHRGLVQKRLNNVPAAFRDFARALQLNPKHIEAEREVRIFAMRARKGSGEHKLAIPLLEKMGKK